MKRDTYWLIGVMIALGASYFIWQFYLRAEQAALQNEIVEKKAAEERAKRDRIFQERMEDEKSERESKQRAEESKRDMLLEASRLSGDIYAKHGTEETRLLYAKQQGAVDEYFAAQKIGDHYEKALSRIPADLPEDQRHEAALNLVRLENALKRIPTDLPHETRMRAAENLVKIERSEKQDSTEVIKARALNAAKQ